MRTETLIVAGSLAIVAGGSLLWSSLSGDQAAMTTREAVLEVAPPPDPSDRTSSLTPSAPVPETAPSADPVSELAEPEGADDTGPILVTTRLSSILASPSASAQVLYAFPAGRPLRVIGREAGFARIKDVKTGAAGWVDERALAPGAATASTGPAAPSAPPASSASVDPEPAPAEESRQAAPVKEKASKPAVTATKPPAPPAAPKQAAKRNQRGLFGGAQSAERRENGFGGFLNRAFGGR